MISQKLQQGPCFGGVLWVFLFWFCFFFWVSGEGFFGAVVCFFVVRVFLKDKSHQETYYSEESESAFNYLHHTKHKYFISFWADLQMAFVSYLFAKRSFVAYNPTHLKGSNLKKSLSSHQYWFTENLSKKTNLD